MNRRDFVWSSISTAASLALSANVEASSGAGQQSPENPHASVPSGKPQQVAMVIYPEMTALDCIGPQAFLAALGNVEVHTVWKDRSPVTTDSGLQLIPSQTFAECPSTLDVLFIGGGSQGTLALMNDRPVLEFLADRGAKARFVTSVCTGSLVLGAAGLLRGYKATTHWGFRSVLPILGAELAPGRIVQDRNRVTAGGVTAGVDFGLQLAARLRSEAYAEMLQLTFEYNPQPPFHAGEPDVAPKAVTAHLKTMYAPLVSNMQAAAERSRVQWPA